MASAALRSRCTSADSINSSQRRGLGLPIARRAIEHHGGSLALQSAGANGVTAIVSLPAGVYVAD
jgi:signal transduction histidine kinase